MAILNGHVETLLTLCLPILAVRIILLIDPLDQILVFIVQIAATRRRFFLAFAVRLLFDLGGIDFLFRELGAFHKLFDCSHLLVLISLRG